MIQRIGRILDHSRETYFYLRFFGDKGLRIVQKADLVDSGYTCTVYVFQKD